MENEEIKLCKLTAKYLQEYSIKFFDVLEIKPTGEIIYKGRTIETDEEIYKALKETFYKNGE